MPPLPTTPAAPTLAVAVLAPTTGEMAVFGQQLRHGIEMAFDEANNTGGILGRRLVWQLYDTECDYETAAQAVQQALDDGFRLIIGPLCAEAAIAAADYAESGQYLLLVPAAAQPLVTVNGTGQTRPTVFRLSPPLAAPGQAAAQFAVDRLQVTSGAVISAAGDESAVAEGQAFADQFSKLGGEILAQAALNPYQSDIAAPVEVVFRRKPQALFLPGSPELVNRVAGLLDERWPADSEKPALLGGDGWSAPEIERGLIEGGYFATYFALPPANSQAQSWAEAYKATYAIEPGPLAGLGYEAASVLLSAVRQGQEISPLGVADTLQNNTFAGLTTSVRFDRQHNPVRAIPVLQVRDGQTVFVTAVDIH